MIGDDGLERRAVPEVQRIDRLHVIVTVEQDMRTALTVALADDRRMPGGRAHVGRKTDGGDIRSEMIRRLFAINRERRIGGDRLDPEQREQPLKAVVEFLVDVIENGGELRCG